MFYSLDHLLDTSKIIVRAAHTKATGHLLYVYAYFLGVGDMGRILIQSPGSFRFCRNAQA